MTWLAVAAACASLPSGSQTQPARPPHGGTRPAGAEPVPNPSAKPQHGPMQPPPQADAGSQPPEEGAPPVEPGNQVGDAQSADSLARCLSGTDLPLEQHLAVCSELLPEGVCRSGFRSATTVEKFDDGFVEPCLAEQCALPAFDVEMCPGVSAFDPNLALIQKEFLFSLVRTRFGRSEAQRAVLGLVNGIRRVYAIDRGEREAENARRLRLTLLSIDLKVDAKTGALVHVLSDGAGRPFATLVGARTTEELVRAIGKARCAALSGKRGFVRADRRLPFHVVKAALAAVAECHAEQDFELDMSTPLPEPRR